MALLSTIASRAQNSALLRPPPGAKLALVVFEDLECPSCAMANQQLEEASRVYNIPLVRYDFPLPMHDWSQRAAVLARYFDTKSKKLGDEFRDTVFQHQSEITKDNLQGFAEKFAAAHGTALPFALDPQGKLATQVKADYELGRRLGIHQTPTIYVVSNKQQGTPFVEVSDRTQLFRLIDAMKAEVK
jgi:protein-disulfide isomerase